MVLGSGGTQWKGKERAEDGLMSYVLFSKLCIINASSYLAVTHRHKSREKMRKI